MLRRSAATAALVTLALGAPAWPQGTGVFTLAGPPDQEVEIEADRMVYGWEAQTLQLEGHVVARRGPGILRAASGTLDRAHGILTLSGGVLGVQGKDVLLADSAVVDLNAHSADLKDAVLYLKAMPANPDAPKAGANTLTLHGKRIRPIPGGYLAEACRLTPCDCAGEPDDELPADNDPPDHDPAPLGGRARRRPFQPSDRERRVGLRHRRGRRDRRDGRPRSAAVRARKPAGPAPDRYRRVERAGAADGRRRRRADAGHPHRERAVPRPPPLRGRAALDVPARAGGVRATGAHPARAADVRGRSRRRAVRALRGCRTGGTPHGIRADRSGRVGQGTRPALRRLARAGPAARPLAARALGSAGDERVRSPRRG